MSLQQLVILGAFGMLLLLAVSRVVRVHRGLTPHPEGTARFVFILAFLFGPPIALELVSNPTAASGQVHGVESVLLYIVAVGAFSILMGFAALVVRLVAPGQSRPLLLLALVGSERDPYEVAFDPPVTAKLAESLALVDRANAAFPRGREFPAQIDRAGFRDAWDALDAATGTLEGRIVDDHRLGVAVASAATATAKDARSRLDTLRNLAIDHGQAWAT
jgi:hypothetical protein